MHSAERQLFQLFSFTSSESAMFSTVALNGQTIFWAFQVFTLPEHHCRFTYTVIKVQAFSFILPPVNMCQVSHVFRQRHHHPELTSPRIMRRMFHWHYVFIPVCEYSWKYCRRRSLNRELRRRDAEMEGDRAVCWAVMLFCSVLSGFRSLT